MFFFRQNSVMKFHSAICLEMHLYVQAPFWSAVVPESTLMWQHRYFGVVWLASMPSPNCYTYKQIYVSTQREQRLRSRGSLSWGKKGAAGAKKVFRLCEWQVAYIFELAERWNLRRVKRLGILYLLLFYGLTHGQMNTKAKCRHLKKICL